MTSILRIEKLKKLYGTKTAVDDISFTIQGGEIVGLLGPNGAGKTTIINMILGVLQEFHFVRKHGGAVLWTSHNMYEVEEVCDRVLFLANTKILLSGKPKELATKYGKKTLEELFIYAARNL